MSRECQLGGEKVPCNDFFTRVPTDSGIGFWFVPPIICYSGMCCALNTEKSLKNSTYSRLVEEMQGNGEKRKVPLYVGKREGLTLILDLHSNRASLGTVARNSDAFNIFIGTVSKTIKEFFDFYSRESSWTESILVKKKKRYANAQCRINCLHQFKDIV